MIWQLLRRICGAGLLIFSLFVFTWGVAPVRVSSHAIPILREDLKFEKSATLADEQPVAWLRYQGPEKLRKGDTGKVKLTFEWIESAIDNSLGEGLALTSQLDLTGIPHTPTGEISQALVIEHPAVFLWSLRAAKPGKFPGKLWLHLRSRPEADGLMARRLLAVHSFDTHVDSLIGLNGDQGRVFGMMGMVVGILAGFYEALFRLIVLIRRRIYA